METADGFFLPVAAAVHDSSGLEERATDPQL